MRFTRWPLWLQLTSAMTAASVAVALAAGQVMRAIETDYLRDTLRRDSLRASEAMTVALADTVASGATAEIENLVARTHRDDAYLHSLAMVDARGRTISRWVGEGDPIPGSVFYFSIPRQLPGGEGGQLVVSWNVSGLIARVQRHVERLRVNVLSTVGVLGALLVILVHFLVIKPVDALRGGLDALAQGARGARVRLPRFAASELDRLADTVSELDRYQHALREAHDSLEQARRQAESASEAKGRFLAVMSHEVRTPINGVIGSLELLDNGALDNSQRALVASAQRSADALLELINEILDFSRIESGRLALEALDFPLEAQINDVAAAMAGLVDSTRVELLVDFDPALPERMRGDPLRLRQVITNLLGNAAKFTSEGLIVLRALRAGDDRDRLRVEVEDTGIGIDPSEHDQLFEPFTQADASTTRHFGGTGLGLSICKQLVELMGGRLGLDSEPGVGSRFWLELPLEERGPARSLSVAELRGQSALLVEPQPRTRAVLERYLRSFGLDVHTIASGEPELHIPEREAAAARFVLIEARLVADSVGEARVRALRSASAEHARVVLLVSPGTRVAPAVPVDATVLKPVTRDELLDALSTSTVPEDTAPQRPLPEAVSAHAGRVLLVDDNPLNRQVAVAMLERLGLEAEVAASGEEALARIANDDFDVVLMDEQMPGMDGLQATRRIREGAKPELPVVALTANADRAAERRCLEAGMNAFLAKPVRRRALREALSRWIPALAETAEG